MTIRSKGSGKRQKESEHTSKETVIGDRCMLVLLMQWI